jgi:glutaredoxin 3
MEAAQKKAQQMIDDNAVSTYKDCDLGRIGLDG